MTGLGGRSPRILGQALCVCLLTGALAGCAAVQATPEPDPADRLARGLRALEEQEYSAAYDDLVWVYTRHWNQPVGQRALLALAAAELDPRNPLRRLGTGSELVGRYLRLPGVPDWTAPVGESMYLLALELGAAEKRVEQAEVERERAEAQAERAEELAERARAQAGRAEQPPAQAAPPRPLPELPGPPVTARIRELEQERNQLASRVEELEGLVANLRQEVAAREQELDRVRETLRQP